MTAVGTPHVPMQLQGPDGQRLLEAHDTGKGHRDMRTTVIGCLVIASVAGCTADQPGTAESTTRADTAFAELQERGHAAMGVDQYTSTHRFDDLPDGGRIELQRDVDDPEGVAVIRRHLQEIVAAFQAGDFSTPRAVHDRAVPGADVMAQKRNEIRYTYADLTRGGEVVIYTADRDAVAAIHRFMAFQRTDHRAGGHDGAHPRGDG
jgi:hypothetical protein